MTVSYKMIYTKLSMRYESNFEAQKVKDKFKKGAIFLIISIILFCPLYMTTTNNKFILLTFCLFT